MNQPPNAQAILDAMPKPPQRYTDVRQVPQQPAEQVQQPDPRLLPPANATPARAPVFQRASDRRDTEIYGPDSDGARDRYWDPLVVHRRLAAALEGNPAQWLQDCQSKDPVLKNKALEKTYPAIVYAFDLVPFDIMTGCGTTEKQAKELMNRFHAWLEKKNPTPDTSPTPSEPQASGHPTSTFGAPGVTINPSAPDTSGATFMASGWESGSTRSGCGCNDQPTMPSPAASPAPNRFRASGSTP